MGIRAGTEPARPRSGIHAVRHVELYRSVSAHAGVRHRGRGHEWLQFSFPKSSKFDRFRCQRFRACFPVWKMVDASYCGMAPRRGRSHSLQHDVDSATGAGNLGDVRRKPDGDHLHHRGDCRIRGKHVIGCLHSIPGRCRFHCRRIRADLRSIGSVGTLRTENRKQHRRRPGKIVGGRIVHLRFHISGCG